MREILAVKSQDADQSQRGILIRKAGTQGINVFLGIGDPASFLSPTFAFAPPVSSFFPFETFGRAIAGHLIRQGRYS